MKKIILILVVLCAARAARAQQPEYVAPHYRANGTFVPGYFRTHKDNTANDNYGYSGNYNPYTGGEGRTTVQTFDGVHGFYNGRAVINRGGQWYYAR